MTVYVEENLEPSQTFETDIFGKTVKGFKLQLSVQELSLGYLNEILIKTYENFLKTSWFVRKMLGISRSIPVSFVSSYTLAI